MPATVATSHKGILPGSDIVLLLKYPNSNINNDQLVKEITGKKNPKREDQ